MLRSKFLIFQGNREFWRNSSAIYNLGIRDAECDKNTNKQREDYVEIALLMFYPFCNLADIQLEGSFWKLFFRDLQLFKHKTNNKSVGKGFQNHPKHRK
jgi:hypothetical protein